MFRRLLMLVAAFVFAVNSLAEDRVALVIGNAKYDGDAALKNPANDADAIAAALAKLEFKVTKKTDVDLTQLEDAVVAFRKALKKNSVAFFFYAGHGVQVKGENFLVPVRATLKEEFQVKDKCYKLDQVLAALDDSEAALKLVVLDCCRDNPFTRSWTRGGTQNKGLASIDVPNGTIIAFSTAPGQTALDGRGANSPYTSHLVASLGSRPKDGLEVKEVFFAASRAVFKEVGQRPWINLDGSLESHYLWRNDPGAPVKKSFVEALGELSAADRQIHLAWNHTNSTSLFTKDQLQPQKFAEIEREIADGKRRLQIGLSTSDLQANGPPPAFDHLCDVWFTVSDDSFTANHVAGVAKCSQIHLLWLDTHNKLAPSPGAMKAIAELKSIKELKVFPYRGEVELSASDFQDLAKSPVLEEIEFRGKISDRAAAGIASFAETKNLKSLNFFDCEPSEKLLSALKSLQQQRPTLHVVAPKVAAKTVPMPTEPARAYLGGIPNYTSEIKNGFELSGVSANSPADKAGLKAGDVILKIGDVSVKGPLELDTVLRSHRPGDVVKVEIRRGVFHRTLDVTLGEKP